MGKYDSDIQWELTDLITIIPSTDGDPKKIAWVGAGIQDIEFARAFALDLLKKCETLEFENQLISMNSAMDANGIPC